MPTIRRVLITGVNGQDGSILAESLVAEGIEVHGIGSLNEPPNEVIRRDVTFHKASISNESEISKLLLQISPDVIYHLAAQSSVSRSFEDVSGTFETNILSSIALLKSVLLHTPNCRVILAGSSEMFDLNSRQPWDIETALKPANPYGASKAITFIIAELYRKMGLNVATAILFNHESRRRPKHFLTRKVIDSAIDVSKGRAQSITIGDLNLIRDFGYAPEYMEAMKEISKLDVLEDFVICTGKPISLFDFASTALVYLGLDNPKDYIVSDPLLIRKNEALSVVGDPKRTTETLGWSAKIHSTSLVELLTSQALLEEDSN